MKFAIPNSSLGVLPLLQRRHALWTLAAFAAAPAISQTRSAAAAITEGTWSDPTRQRDIPWRLYFPAAGPTAANDMPWVIFSHGLGGSRTAGELWARAWAAGGVATLAIQHAGSDSGLIGSGRGLSALRAGMTPENLTLRVQDVHFSIDQVLRLRTATEAPWSRLSAERIGMAGHSFGALTTQAIAGQRMAPNYGPPPFADPRIKAAIAFSPSARGADPQRAFGKIAIPFMGFTGTEDSASALNDVSAANRVLPFEGLSPGDKFLLVFNGAVHASFSGSVGGRYADKPAASERVRPFIEQASTWFWQAYLAQDAVALSKLRELDQQLGVAAGDLVRMR